MALNATIEASHAATSRLETLPEANSPERLRSTSNITVSSRSSRNFFTNGWFMRAVTFQSMVRTSSPGWYSRTSSKSMPAPLKAEWYWPANESDTSRRVRISICRILRSRSSAVMRWAAWTCRSRCARANPHGTGNSSRMRCTMPSDVLSSASASYVTVTRCRSTSMATLFTSCGVT